MTENTTPETFNFDDWFSDAKRPEESVDVYTRADVVSRLSELRRRIEEAQQIADADAHEAAIGEASPATELEAEYVDLLQTFADSRVTFFVQALTQTERRRIRQRNNERDNGDNGEFVHRMIAEAIVGVRRGNGERIPATLTLNQVRDLYDRIGDPQHGELFEAVQQASNGLPEVSADFLHEHSGHAGGQG